MKNHNRSKRLARKACLNEMKDWGVGGGGAAYAAVICSSEWRGHWQKQQVRTSAQGDKEDERSAAIGRSDTLLARIAGDNACI